MATTMDLSSAPKDLTRSLRVIGAGYPRTATVSFSMALEILLKGPVMHSGTACMVREEGFMVDVIEILNSDPAKDGEMVKKKLKSLTAGYMALADCPAVLFTGELVEMFPDAIVICTVRDPKTWWESFKETSDTVLLLAILDFIFIPVPTLRYFGRWVKALTRRHAVIYNNGKEPYDMSAEHLERHVNYVKSVTPADRLFFFNVKDGWEPLCKILNVPVPDQPFPRANDRDAIQRVMGGFVKRALGRWAVILTTLAVGAGSVVWAFRG